MDIALYYTEFQHYHSIFVRPIQSYLLHVTTNWEVTPNLAILIKI